MPDRDDKHIIYHQEVGGIVSYLLSIGIVIAVDCISCTLMMIMMMMMMTMLLEQLRTRALFC